MHCITLHCSILHCIALNYIALHYIALHCIALHCIALHYITLHYLASHNITLNCTALHCITLHYTAVHCITLHCTALHCITLHYNAVHCSTLQYTAVHCIALHYTILPSRRTGPKRQGRGAISEVPSRFRFVAPLRASPCRRGGAYRTLRADMKPPCSRYCRSTACSILRADIKSPCNRHANAVSLLSRDHVQHPAGRRRVVAHVRASAAATTGISARGSSLLSSSSSFFPLFVFIPRGRSASRFVSSPRVASPEIETRSSDDRDRRSLGAVRGIDARERTTRRRRPIRRGPVEMTCCASISAVSITDA